MDPVGYPSIALYTIILIGLPLAIIRPFYAFLMVIIISSGIDSTSLTYTRTQFLGPYFNANDACLLIALSAILSYCVILNNNIYIPSISKLMVAILLIGFVQSLLIYKGSTYKVFQAMRWAIGLPLYMIVSATIVKKPKELRLVLAAIIFGSVISALQHITFVKSLIEFSETTAGNIAYYRTNVFSSPGQWILISGILWLHRIRIGYRPLGVIVVILFSISVFLSQTRSVWISLIASLLVALPIYQDRNIRKNIILILLVGITIFFGVRGIINHILPEATIEEIIVQRFDPFREEDSPFESTFGRKLDFEIELKEWMKGTMIFGRGLSYFYSNEFKIYESLDVAWGHLGHVTVLAQLGVFGLIVYSILFPAIIIKSSIKLWKITTGDIKYLGLLAGVCMISSWICFFMSGSFLNQNVVLGIIFGTTYRQAMYLTRYPIHSTV